MAVKIKTQSGMIDIDNDVISAVVGGAATDNYGVVGMASRNPLRDGVNQILRRENFSRGVVVRQQDNGQCLALQQTQLMFVFKVFAHLMINLRY